MSVPPVREQSASPAAPGERVIYPRDLSDPAHHHHRRRRGALWIIYTGVGCNPR